MIHSQSSLPDPPHLALLARTPSLLLPSHGDIQCDPRPGAQLGRQAEQSPLTGYEPNDLTEVNNSEVAPALFQRSSACSASI